MQYEDWRKNGLSQEAATRMMDYEIALKAARRRLQKKGLHREPTEREVNAILASM